MRTNLSEEDKSYIQELKEAIKENPKFADEIVTIGDNMMTVKQAIMLEHELTNISYRAKQTGSK